MARISEFLISGYSCQCPFSRLAAAARTVTSSTRIQTSFPMKTLLTLICLASVVTLTGVAAEKPANAKRLLHVVAFKFKSSATKEQIQEVTEAFGALKKKVPSIQSLEWGTNISPEKHDKGFTHGWVLSFKSEKDRDDYLVHPEHKAFGKIVGPVLEDVFVIDYWARE